MVQEYEADRELDELMAKLRKTMKAVKAQLSTIEDTISSCEVVTGKKYHECVNAASIAEVEAIRFMELNVELVNLLNTLRNHVFTRHL